MIEKLREKQTNLTRNKSTI